MPTRPRPQCPRCSQVLVVAQRQGVEVDYCPACLGVWLDRGEIEKVVNAMATVDLETHAYRFEYETEPQAMSRGSAFLDDLYRLT